MPLFIRGTFPFDQTEALARAKRWTAATPIERLSLQRQWTEEFREEYRRAPTMSVHDRG